ncbi:MULTISPECIES: Bax inhibitor-1/YccA family protein [unclassified Devosia]|uniref:Bax inhibitor-1/YccA family protein n=1 Tax=unclassified Devosia TaxID=196773 RepID=UPI00145F52D1|nr:MULTISPECIES: Bax inhibitor-1/YccA family protein [unclassified Devosia]MBJ6988508.1 Bax inhibitor-1/YccA family protein [Devosia sp. MC521]QMW62549.1 Bax inhibitor-1/YccA family protein [Devosia sp. MC521]
MAEYDRQTLGARAGSALAIDEGLRSYMLKVYNYMGLGLVITGLVAFFASQAAVTADPSSAVAQLGNGQYLTNWGGLLFTSPLAWVIMLAPLGFVLVLSFGINKLSVPAAQGVFWAFAAIMGLSLSSIFLVYTGASIAKVFFITAATFGAMSLYGYTTKRDLTGMGNFLMMGLIGIIIASIVNIFMQSSMMDFIISVVGVLIFTGLTAYDTQKIKESYSASFGADVMAKNAIMGALSLYMDFINLFMMLLRLFGNRE